MNKLLQFFNFELGIIYPVIKLQSSGNVVFNVPLTAVRAGGRKMDYIVRHNRIYLFDLFCFNFYVDYIFVSKWKDPFNGVKVSELFKVIKHFYLNNNYKNFGGVIHFIYIYIQKITIWQ